MEVSEIKRSRQLEAENTKLKRLYGEAELDKAALKKLVEGKWCLPRSDVGPWNTPPSVSSCPPSLRGDSKGGDNYPDKRGGDNLVRLP